MERAGLINVYTCDKCGARHVTRNRDAGVTPFLIGCRAMVKAGKGKMVQCDGLAQSCCYHTNQNEKPRFEWYRPLADEMDGLDKWSKDHTSKGGLLLRELPREEIEAGQPWG